MKYIGYYRVSTKRQGNSGLGLEAQKSAVMNFLKNDDVLLKSYTDIESGKSNNRPNLLKAIEHSKNENATLLIAKLDRLSRNASFIFMLRDTNVSFKAVDIPEANSVTIGIMAVLAQDERERISQRTKSALTELKRNGVKLGKPENLTDYSRERSLIIRKQNAVNNKNNRLATALIVSMRNEDISFSKIADKLNKSGFKTRRNNNFSSMTVKRLYDRHLKNVDTK